MSALLRTVIAMACLTALAPFGAANAANISGQDWGTTQSGEKVSLLSENESTYIPIGMNHRLENPGKVPLHIIEVQSGSYLGEDDIVRLEDTYGRT